MTCSTTRILFCASLMLSAFAAGSFAPADEPKQPAKGPDANDDENYRREAEKIVGGIELEMLVNEKWVKVKRIEKPLLSFGDATRSHQRGSLWAWGDKGRPVAVLELFRDSDRKKWVCSLCNTSGGKVRAARDGREWWKENESASELKDVPGADAPAADAAQRQRQLKGLAQKFTCHQFWDPNNSRYELRRLEKPLLTYRDPDAGILDGAFFVLANGTNPEVLLFLEARANPKDATKHTWRFAVGRSSHAAIHLLYDEKEVYESPRADRVPLCAPDKPYWVTDIVAPAPEEPKKK
jgi:hypothetical protein